MGFKTSQALKKINKDDAPTAQLLQQSISYHRIDRIIFGGAYIVRVFVLAVW